MANEEHLALLKQGAKEWNQWRKKHKRVIPDLARANLCHLNFNGFNLKQANLNRANLSHSNLNNADLANANLEGANLLGADLRGANLRGANLDYVIFSQTQIDGKTAIALKNRQVWEIVNRKTHNKNFSGMDLSCANLFRADFSNADLSNAKLNHTNLSYANLEDAYLHKADLREANLNHANLSNAYFSRADLTRAYLGGASCGGTYFKDADLKFANLKTAKINHKTMIDLKWYSVWEVVNRGAAKKNLSGIDLSNANLYGVNFEEANLTNANLSHSILTSSNLDRANLKGAKLKAVVSDRNTQLPTAVKTPKTSVIVKERPKIKLKTVFFAQNKQKSAKKTLFWLFILVIIGFIAAGSYIFIHNNPHYPWQQKLEKLFSLA